MLKKFLDIKKSWAQMLHTAVHAVAISRVFVKQFFSVKKNPKFETFDWYGLKILD